MNDQAHTLEAAPDFSVDSTAGMEAPRKERRPRKGKGRKEGKAPAARKGLNRGELLRATAFAALAGAGLVVSLPHLASEVGSLTGASSAAAWFTALVIDLGLCASKAHLSARGPKQGVAWSVVVACSCLSVVLNCHAFLEHARTAFAQTAAVGFGCFVPLFVVAMSYLASETVLKHKD
jgi:hypothetical protein